MYVEIRVHCSWQLIGFGLVRDRIDAPALLSGTIFSYFRVSLTGIIELVTPRLSIEEGII